jgi:DNA-binding response OmpR family regulator
VAGERVLIVDDDAYIARYLLRALTQEGFEASVAASALEARALVQELQPALILLDVMLPDADGEVLVAQLRSMSSAIIIMLTAKTNLETRVASLDLGADDYVAKPFQLRELLARMRAALRRHRPAAPEVLRFAGIEVDPARRTARRGERLLDLTAKEFDLLQLLISRPRQVLARSTIVNALWPESEMEASNAFEVHLHHLRAKLHRPGEAPLLHTIRGVGYVLREPAGIG